MVNIVGMKTYLLGVGKTCICESSWQALYIAFNY
uniref:Uncharacterized protein n=1 Tax=Rhizophora mucronata TaxID=61149 RepID=A0A2P2NX45_RHIMU